MHCNSTTSRLTLSFTTMGVLFGLIASSVTAAQEGHTLNWPVGEFRPYSIDSGMLANADPSAAAVYRTTVHIDNAA